MGSSGTTIILLVVLCLCNLGLAKGEVVGGGGERWMGSGWNDGSAILGDSDGVSA